MKTTTKVFLMIATLVGIFLAWALFFDTNGVLETGWNAMVGPVNDTWQKITGDNSATIIPEFKSDDNTGLDDAGTGW